MAMIPQISIFDNTEVYDNLGDLERVKLILDNIPDEKLLNTIRKDKDVKGRKGISLEALMNIFLFLMVQQQQEKVIGKKALLLNYSAALKIV